MRVGETGNLAILRPGTATCYWPVVNRSARASSTSNRAGIAVMRARSGTFQKVGANPKRLHVPGGGSATYPDRLVYAIELT